MSKDSVNTHFVAKQYESPPLIEALVEIYFSGIEPNILHWGKFYNKIRSKYPEHEEFYLPHTEISVSEDGKNTGRPMIDHGIRLLNSERSQLIQATNRVFTLNRVSKYNGFDQLRKDVAESVEHYLSVFCPTMINRIGVRYINQIQLPINEKNEIEYKEYLQLFPNIPDPFAVPLNGFTIGVSYTREAQHQVNVALEALKTTNLCTLDIYDSVIVNNDVEMEFILKHVDIGHDSVQQVFEGTITDKTRELFAV